MKKYFVFLVFFGFLNCEKAFMKEVPATDPESIFEEYWKIVNEKFAMFDDPLKNINKKKLYKTTKAKIKPNMTNANLFKVLSQITVALKDSHSTLRDPKTNKFTSYNAVGFLNYHPEVIKNNYLKKGLQIGQNKNHKGAALQYVILKNVGYMRLETFEKIEFTSDMMDMVLDYFKNTKGIILDVRGNGGGSPYISTMIARHFTNKKVFVGTTYFKIGPGEKDFATSKIYVNPKGLYYQKPLVVLTDLGCYSATSIMIAYLRAIRYYKGHSNIRFIGQKTRGGMGSATEGYLANGWIWQITSNELREFNGGRYDNGLQPDIKSEDDRNTKNKDEVIEKAIRILE